MARPGSARIRSPEIIRQFRRKYVEFDEQVHRAFDTMSGDLQSVSVWLSRELLPYWKAQYSRRHDEVKRCWREYVDARYGDRRMGKPSCVDERKAWERARRRKEEAEAKIAIVKRWLLLLEREAEKLMPPVKRFETLIDSLTPKALARLDHMLDRLDEYLRPAPRGGADGAPKAGTRGREDGSDQPRGADADGGPERSGA